MKIHSPLQLLFTSVFSGILSFNTLADTASAVSDGLNPGDSDSKWVAGAMALSLSNIYQDADNINLLVPVLEYRGDIIFLKDGELGAKLLSTGETEHGVLSGGLLLGGQASYLDDKDTYEDDSALIGLEERESIAEAGVYLRHKNEMGQAKLKFFGDLHSEKYGNRAEAQYIFALNKEQWQLNQSITLIWEDSDRIDHFYGVSQSESTANRAEYKGQSAINLALGIDGQYRVNKNWDVKAAVGYVFLDDAITDSSIVSDDDISFISLGTQYNF